MALVQENFPISVTRASENDRDVFDAHLKLTLEAWETYKPDLIVWPESMAQPFLSPKVEELIDEKGSFRIPIKGKAEIWSPGDWLANDFRNAEYAQRELSKLAQRVNAHLLVGSAARTYYSDADGQVDREFRNSAFLCRSDGLILHQRYDKIHPVPFSEYIPLRKSVPLFRELVIKFSPYDFDYSMEHGSGPEIFAITTADGESSFRFATPICYEGTVPDLCRKFVLPEAEDGIKIDFLVNISNDGWFNASWELNQHLVCYVFRAVENRIAIARAVNTGISGFVDSVGRLHDLVSQDGQRRGVAGVACAQLQIDSRISVYSRTGDWFALLCGVCGLAVFVDSLRGPWRGRRGKLLLVLLAGVMLADAVGRWLL